MPLMYPVKHVYRNWKLFTALLIGIVLAATFFAAIGVKANLSAEQSIDNQLKSTQRDMEFTVPLNQTNLNLAYRNITSISGVKDVEMLARLGYASVRFSSDNFSSFWNPLMTSFPSTSSIYDEWINKPADGVPENYTYLIAGTPLAQQLKIGDNISTMITFQQPKYYNQSTIYVNFTVAGFAQLTDKGYGMLSGYGGGVIPLMARDSIISTSSGWSAGGWRSDTMIIGWESTLEKLWNTTLDSSTIQVTFSVNVDRQALISPWNIDASIHKIDVIYQTIENDILGSYLAHLDSSYNYLSNTLDNFQINFSATLVSYFILSIPVFFIAWYIGSTVSDVSFNIRRREIGLLSTKGLSSGQIQRMFLTEAVIIGLAGGALGVIGGIILNQYYVGALDINSIFGSAMFNPFLIAATLIFSIVLALFAVFWSARQASKMPAVETLRNYMPAQPAKNWMKAIHVIALALGTYKMVVFALGLNMSQLFYQISSTSGNFFISLIRQPVLWVDGVLTFLGPFLFLWGLTKLLIRDSTKFQQLATKISSVMGDLGALAAKNVRRNPARLAAIAFIIALIVAFSVQVTGQIASQQDYIVRQVRSSAGADVSVSVANATKGQLILNDILANVSGIQTASIRRELYPQLGSWSTLPIHTIDPNNWTATAYYEDGWFSGATVQQMMEAMRNDNNTIILDRSVAQQMDKKVGDEITINFASCPRQLEIVGFYGYDNPSYQAQNRPPSYIGGVTTSPGFGGKSPDVYIYSSYNSYVPNNLFNVSSPFSDIYDLESFSTTLLLKLEPGVNGTQVADQIRERQGYEVVSVNSFDEEWQLSESNNNMYTFSSLQALDVQGLGMVFAVLSASVGTALIATVSLKERSREATLMSVRGLSYRQLVWMFLTETMAIITFAVIIGLVAGGTIIYGNIASANAYGYAQLVQPRLIYPADAVTTIGTYIALIYASTIGAIIVMTSQYVTKLERMVRTK